MAVVAREKYSPAGRADGVGNKRVLHECSFPGNTVYVGGAGIPAAIGRDGLLCVIICKDDQYIGFLLSIGVQAKEKNRQYKQLHILM
jgi:hypothetical protein